MAEAVIAGLAFCLHRVPAPLTSAVFEIVVLRVAVLEATVAKALVAGEAVGSHSMPTSIAHILSVFAWPTLQHPTAVA